MRDNARMKQLTAIQPLPGYRLKLCFDDGVEGIVDLSAEVGKEAFAAWREVSHFNRVRIGEFGGPVWEGGIDLCADALYLEVTGKTVEELFPKWKPEATHA